MFKDEKYQIKHFFSHNFSKTNLDATKEESQDFKVKIQVNGLTLDASGKLTENFFEKVTKDFYNLLNQLVQSSRESKFFIHFKKCFILRTKRKTTYCEKYTFLLGYVPGCN